MAIKFYYSPMSSATRCQWALEELGVPYEKHKLDLKAGEQKSPDFLAINPNGKIPALVDGDTRVFESLAIILYLGDRYGVEKGLWPKLGTPDHGDALSWAVWGTTEAMPNVIQRVMHAGSAGFSLPADKKSPFLAEMAAEGWAARMKILDKRLEGREYLAGKGFTLADVATASVVGFAAMMAQLPLDPYKNVGAWAARCQSRPAMGRAMAG